jgi:FOG: Ankyrin repeat
MLWARCHNKESEIIQLIHYTLQEYFQDTLTRWFPTAHLDIANTCVSYLSFKDFSGGPVRTSEEARERLEKPLFTYAADYWGHHISACSACVPQLLNLLTSSEWVSMVVQLCDRFSETRRRPWLLHHRNQSSEYLRPSQNAFHIVGAYGLNNVVKLLLTSAKDIHPDQPDRRGRTPLSWAARNGHTEVVKALLSDGRVDPNRQDNGGLTPLSWAAENGHTEVVKILLSDGRTDPDRQDNDGITPLSCAAGNGHTEIVKILLSDGRVNPDRQDNGGQTPLSLAAKNGYTEVVKILLSDGPRRRPFKVCM